VSVPRSSTSANICSSTDRIAIDLLLRLLYTDEVRGRRGAIPIGGHFTRVIRERVV